MIRGFYTARTGLTAHQARLDTIANNMANVSTTGFKPMRTAFKDLVYQNLNRPTTEDTATVGHGVKVNKNDILMQLGAPNPTGRDLDFALIDANAFFALETPTGEIRYTRDGNFSLSNVDDTYYLVGANGDRVLNVDEEAFEVEIDENGRYTTINAEDLAVYSFPNPLALWSMEGTTFSPTAESGDGELIENPTIMPGYLENSAVEIASEMTSMIEANRAFSFNARMVQTADEVEQIVNTLRQ
jgi:flagellar basal-body rod protein FlgG